MNSFEPSFIYLYFLGTPTYMSPEILSGGDGYGTRTDIWSLAAVVFKFANDRPLFEDIDDVMDWENQPYSYKTYKIADTNIGDFSSKFRWFFLKMLSIERYRPHSVTVLQKSQQRENRKPYQIDTGDSYWSPEWIFIN